ncbi:hypothetical protein HGRIS_005303 [Hohenbuehelia grisea]|uniref:RRM Nup35-type domain-containing protein n=1 Tax=Hohenbuehelia grisea TaxID=104357 RepID=A0ABR3JF34_9AGAR
MMHNSPFASSGMSSTSTSHAHASNTSSWGGPSGGGFNDSLSQSRTHYQPGYMLSASQSSSTSPGTQRNDEMPVVQTKAKLNSLVSRGPTSDFGMSSMFGSSSRKRQNVTDEDAPPTNSVNDIPNEIFADSPSRPPRNQTMASFDSSLRRHQHAPSAPQQSQHVYIIVFGYPPDKYTQTVDFFKSLGNSTEADLNLEVANCFKIGYKDLGDAMRAVRKNGDILGGSWMIGVKWAVCRLTIATSKTFHLM